MGQKIFRFGNLRKTYFYLKKNGVKSAYYAALERIMSEKGSAYRYKPPGDEVFAAQRGTGCKFPYRFSILVPAYETKEAYLREMMDSVLGQSYGKFELIIADASRCGKVEQTVRLYMEEDERVRYLRLKENKGISENTNQALAAAQGDYIGLLDHDDTLTPDALYRMAKAIAQKEKEGGTAWLLYSDEDKGNGDLTAFYEPHFKPGLNVDLLLSNNYICHFLVMKRELMQGLGFRPEYDGAQDYDLALRAIGRLLYGEGGSGRFGRRVWDGGPGGAAGRDAVVHIPSVLYHWRCHESSTADNPESKRYAYEAGKRALEDFLKERGWQGSVLHTKHLGFYRIAYKGGIFAQRPEVGVVGGKIIDRRGKICGGALDEKGEVMYLGLHKEFSGYMHRASLLQEAYAADIRRMRVRRELWGAFREVFGVPYAETEEGWFDCAEAKNWDNGLPAKWADRCLEFGRRVRREGFVAVFLGE